MSTIVRIGGGSGGYKNRKIYLRAVRSSETFVAPKSTYYHIVVVGSGGSLYTSESSSSTYYSSGGGGGVAVLKKFLNKGEEIPITVTTSISSFGSYASAYSGSSGSSSSAGQGGKAVGGDVNATGTNGESGWRKFGTNPTTGFLPGHPTLDTLLSSSQYIPGTTEMYSSYENMFNLGLGEGRKFNKTSSEEWSTQVLSRTEGGVLVEWN